MTNISNNTLLIYGLIDPITQELRYIGLSKKGLYRPKSHICPSKLYRIDRKSRKFSHCQLWLQKLVKADQKPEIVIIEICNNIKDLNEAEQFYISYYKSIGCRLTNIQKGGYEGRGGGWKHSAETIEKLKKSAQERYNKDPSSIKAANVANAIKLKGVKRTQESIDKQVASLKASGHYRYPVEAVQNAIKRRKQIVDDTGKIWESISHAAKALNTSGSNIRRQIRGELNHVRGLKFKLLE